MYKGIRKKKRENLQDVKLLKMLKLDVKTYPCQKLTNYNRSVVFFHIKTLATCNKLVMEMEGVY